MARKKAKTSDVNTGTDSTPKRKGRPAGSMREIFVVCSGLYEDSEGEAQLGSEKFHVVIDKDATDMQLLAAGKKMFQTRFSVEPSTVLGPFFERKGKSGYVKKRDSIRIDVDDLQFSGKSAKGVYNGWNVAINYLKNPEGYVYIMFKDEVTPSDKAKARPQPKTVALNAVASITA